LQLLLILIYTALAGLLATRLFTNTGFITISALCFYIAALVLTGLIKRSDWHLFKQTTGW